MRVLVLSDIHANLVALEAVLADAQECDEIWSLGDIVGYGPAPEACIALLSSVPHVAIPGNHDWGVLGQVDLQHFNEAARKANEWTRERLSEASRRYLERLAVTLEIDEVSLAHGSPREPIWEYLMLPQTAKASFCHFGGWLCLVGHTHVPVIYRDIEGAYDCQAILPPEDVVIQLDEARYIVNPGSVGQPRDRDSRAAYLILDTVARTVAFHRVAYDIASTQQAMREAGLPQRLWQRLEIGW